MMGLFTPKKTTARFIENRLVLFFGDAREAVSWTKPFEQLNSLHLFLESQDKDWVLFAKETAAATPVALATFADYTTAKRALAIATKAIMHPKKMGSSWKISAGAVWSFAFLFCVFFAGMKALTIWASLKSIATTPIELQTSNAGVPGPYGVPMPAQITAPLPTVQQPSSDPLSSAGSPQSADQLIKAPK